MNSAPIQRVLTLEEAASLTPQQVLDLYHTLRGEITALKPQLDGYTRQLFGQKSERRIEIGTNGQMSLGEGLTEPALPEPPRPVDCRAYPQSGDAASG